MAWRPAGHGRERMKTVEECHKAAHWGLWTKEVPRDTIKFHLEMVSDVGTDIHREYIGEYHPEDSTLAIIEVHEVRGRPVMHSAHNRDAYYNPLTQQQYLYSDIVEGAELVFVQHMALPASQDVRATSNSTRIGSIIAPDGDRGQDNERLVTYRVTRVDNGFAKKDYRARGGLNALRDMIVRDAWKKLDAHKTGVVDRHSILPFINTLTLAEESPEDYADRTRAIAQPLDPNDGITLRKFVRSKFPLMERDGTMNYADFKQYYEYVSDAIPSDDEFVALVRATWHLT